MARSGEARYGLIGSGGRVRRRRGKARMSKDIINNCDKQRQEELMDKEKYEQPMASRQNLLEKHGWLIDAVFDMEGCETKCETGTGCDVHTHGLQESFNHPDLQCVLSVDPKMIHSIFCTIVDKIKDGQIFRSGKCYEDILKGGFKVRFVSAKQGDREVLRMILPDKHGKLHKSLMEESFKIQYNGI